MAANATMIARHLVDLFIIFALRPLLSNGCGVDAMVMMWIWKNNNVGLGELVQKMWLFAQFIGGDNNA
jgi:hypothetical protein